MAVRADAAAAGPVRRVPSISTLRLVARPFTTWPFVLLALSQRVGRRFRFRQWPMRDLHYVGTPAGIEQVLVSEATSFVKGRGMRRLSRIVGEGLLTAEQPTHRRNRRLVQPAFHRARLADYAAVMVRRSRAKAESWPIGETIDVEREMNRLAFEIVTETLFGIDLDRETETIGRGLDEAVGTFPWLMVPFSELADGAPALPHNRTLRRALERLHGVVDRLIREHPEGLDRGDLLSMLLAARDEAGERLSPREVRDEALTILLAGHETTANALTWTFYFLQRHPETEAKLHAELRDVLGDRDPELADVPRLPYARAVFSEALRLYPPAWMTSRLAVRDVAIDGAVVRRGQEVLVSQYAVHRDPALWPEPDRFDPERFLDDEARAKFAYWPFGGGTRLCIGEAFAWTEGVLVLATIARRVRLVAVDAAPIRPLPLVTIRLRDRFQARCNLLA